MAGFKFVKNLLNPQAMRFHDDAVIKNSTVLTDGELVTMANGVIDTAVTTSKVYGIARIPGGGSLTGDSGGTVTCQVQLLMPGDILEVAQGAIGDSDCLPGDTVDLATGDAVAADSNHDLRVYQQFTTTNLLWVIPLNRFFL